METKRISKLFSDLYNGDAWIEVTIQGTIKNISAEQALIHPIENLNSIWEIVNHLVSWREVVLSRMEGEIILEPNNNFFEPIIDNSERAWQETLERYDKSQKSWLVYLEKLNSTDLEKIYSGKKYTFYELIHGILQHDAYHLGQIIMLKKLVS
jgi:uncharacterized damage-inducible protein DinB